MKKIIVLSSLVSLSFVMVSCGPSAEEKAKMEQATQDSLKAAEDMMRAAEEAAMAAAASDTLVATDSTQVTETTK